MIQVIPVTDEDELKKYREKFYLPEESVIFVCEESGNYCGFAAAGIKSEKLMIEKIEAVENWTYDLLIRAVLAYGDNRFLTIAETELMKKKEHFLQVGFVEEDGILRISIQKVVHNCKNS